MSFIVLGKSIRAGEQKTFALYGKMFEYGLLKICQYSKFFVERKTFCNLFPLKVRDKYITHDYMRRRDCAICKYFRF